MDRERVEHLLRNAVAMVGVPWDEHSSLHRGCAEGPAAVRAARRSGSMNLYAENGYDLAAEAGLVDVGDVDVSADAFARIQGSFHALATRGARTIAIGGDHAITYPILRGLATAHPGLTILHLDAHPDLYDELDGNRLSHASPFARIMEEGLARRLVQLGIRALSPSQREQGKRFGVQMVSMRRWQADLDVVALGLEPPLYVSLDLDVLDPAYAPGVSHYEPGGASVRDVLRVIQGLPVAPIGADVVELNPRRDHHDMTAMVALKLVKELAARMHEG
ncbi:MAG TPA: agmatinase [Haliangium sp.]|nr:agmatinase [Haliangium sp.]